MSPEIVDPRSSPAGWSLVVEPGADGERLDSFLARRIPRLTRARAAGLVVVDLDDEGRTLKKSTRVRVGQRLWAHRPVPDAGARPVWPTVLAERDGLLVLDKPPGLATHPTATRFRATVTHWLASRGAASSGVHDPSRTAGQPDRVAAPFHEPVHRLDVETSGVLLCASAPADIATLRGVFAERAATKVYLAVVCGVPVVDEWTCERPLGFDAASEVRLKMGPGALPARTRFLVRRRGRSRSVVEAWPLTGRQHQIRAHLALCGHPVVGDKLYGPDERLFLNALERALTPDELALLGHHRHALHAWRLALDWRGGRVRFEAPWPEELEALVAD